MTDDIERILKEISLTLIEHEDLSLSLMEGLPGILIFMNSYAEYKNSETVSGFFSSRIDELIDTLNNSMYIPSLSYCDGLIGLMTFFEYIKRETSNEYYCIDEAIDELVATSMFEELSSGKFDLLHRGLGVYYHFLLRLKNGNETNKDRIKLYLKQALSILDSISIKTSGGCYWLHSVEDNSPLAGKAVCNMGLAHGVPGILMILSYSHTLNIDFEKTDVMIKDTLKFILESKSKDSSSLSQFQTYYIPSLESEFDSRLAWCYGDLGISFAILNAGKALNSQVIMNRAYEIAINTLDRVSIEETFLYDASFCHGTSGVSHLYGLWYNERNDIKFKEAQDFWMKRTIELSNFEEGVAGFKTYINNSSWGTDLGIMKGIAGIGLVMLSYLTGKRNWESLFIL